jgi:MFS family permease
MDDRHAGKRLDLPVPGVDAWRESVAVPVSSQRGRILAARRGSDPVLARQRGTLTAVALAMFCMEVIYLALVLALPDMARLFRTSPEVMQDALSAYLLSHAATLVAAGRMGDVAGRRRVFVAGCLLFAVALVGAALAPSLPLLVVFRVLQGVGAGFMLPTGIALVSNSYSGGDQRDRALALSLALAAIGTVIGPLFGGWLAEGPGWRWIFWLVLPVVVVTVVMTVRFVPESRRKAPAPSFDTLGAVMVVLAVAAVGTGIDRADSVGWSGGNIALLAGGLAVIAVFPVRARHAAHPLVDLSIFRNPRFGLVLFLAVVGSACHAAAIFVVSVDLQDARNLTAVRAGLILAAMAVLFALAALVGTRIRPGSRQDLLLAGAGMISGGALFVLAVVTSWWAYVPAVALCGFGFGLGSSVASIAGPQVAGPGRTGEVSGIMLTMRRTAGGISFAATAGIVEAFEHGEHGEHGIAVACNLALLTIACLSVAASLVAAVAGYALAKRGLIKPEQHRFPS